MLTLRYDHGVSLLSFLLAAALPSGSRPREDEGALLARVAQGEEAALRALYDRCAGQALAVALRILASRAEAEEVVQDTFVDVWARSRQFDPARGGARAWLLAIARNRAIDKLRNRGAVSRMIDRAGDQAATDLPRSESPLESVEHREARDRLGAALLALSGEQRQVLELAYYQGLSQSEIAEQLGEPLGTVKSRVRAALAKLAELVPEGGRA